MGETTCLRLLTDPVVRPFSACDDEHLASGACDGDGTTHDSGYDSSFGAHGGDWGVGKCVGECSATWHGQRAETGRWENGSCDAINDANHV